MRALCPSYTYDIISHVIVHLNFSKIYTRNELFDFFSKFTTCIRRFYGILLKFRSDQLRNSKSSEARPALCVM